MPLELPSLPQIIEASIRHGDASVRLDDALVEAFIEDRIDEIAERVIHAVKITLGTVKRSEMKRILNDLETQISEMVENIFVTLRSQEPHEFPEDLAVAIFDLAQYTSEEAEYLAPVRKTPPKTKKKKDGTARKPPNKLRWNAS